jgi:hypothetical protein
MAQIESLLMFYRPGSGNTGVAVTGRLDANGNYFDLATHTGFDFWTHIVPVGTTSGLVLFQEQPSRKAAVGLVGTDGSFADKNNQPDAPFTPVVVSTRDGILIFYQSASENGVNFGLAQTGRLAANGSFVPLSEPRRLDYWSHVVPTIDGLVLFSLADEGIAATARLSPEGAFQDLKGFTGFDPWTHIVSSSDGVLLFYNAGTGAAVTGTLDAEGNYTDRQNLSLDPEWQQIVPAANGHVLFYRFASPASVAAVGRIDPNGAFADVAPINGLEGWTEIVFVRELIPIT